jgi:hypothetical protein
MGHSTLEMARRYLSIADTNSQKPSAEQAQRIGGDCNIVYRCQNYLSFTHGKFIMQIYGLALLTLRGLLW